MSSLENDYWVDSGSSNMLLTAGSSLIFSDGSLFKSNRITTEAGTITAATLLINAAYVSGTLSYKLSADNGTTFETATLNNQHTFTATGTRIKILVESTGTSLGTGRIRLRNTTGIRSPVAVSYVVATA